MPNYVEYLKVGSGEPWPIKDREAHSLISAIWNTIYPVGSIYMSVSETSPVTLFGGTWERIEDRFLLAAGDTYAAGSIGGEATVALTTHEMPNHTHLQTLRTYSSASTTIYTVPDKAHALVLDQSNTKGPGTSHNVAMLSAGDSQGTGGNQPHNNMPPYLAVYVWKRTA